MQPTPEQLELLRRGSGLTLDAEGELRHEGDPIRHPGLHALFHGGLDVNANGEAIVRIADQWAYVQCAGSPFVVQRLQVDGADVVLHLNTGKSERRTVAALDPKLRGEHELTVALATPGQVARFGRRAWHAIADALDVADDGTVWLNLPGARLFVVQESPSFSALALPAHPHNR